MKRIAVMGSVILVFVLALGGVVWAGSPAGREVAKAEQMQKIDAGNADAISPPVFQGVVVETGEGYVMVYAVQDEYGLTDRLRSVDLPQDFEGVITAGELLEISHTEFVRASYPPQYSATGIEQLGMASDNVYAQAKEAWISHNSQFEQFAPDGEAPPLEIIQVP